MTFKNKNDLWGRKIEINLNGPQGNAYYLLGIATRLAKQLNKDPELIKKEMMESDYEYLLKVFEREFGELVDLYR